MVQPPQHQHHKRDPLHRLAEHALKSPVAAKPTRKLGRKPRSFNPRIPHYSAARLRCTGPLLPLKDTHWGEQLPANTGFMLNDHLGDCPIAGGHHFRQLWTKVAEGAEITDADNWVLADYKAACGYVDGDPSTDNGGVLQDVLAYAVRTGWSTANGPDKLLGVYEADPRNLDDVARVIMECGGAYIGIDIPEAWAQANAGDTWDATDSPIDGGHCVLLVGFTLDAQGHVVSFDVRSWGMAFTMTAAGFQQACDEAYALVDRNWVEKTGLTPANLNVAQVEADMEGMAA